MDEQYTKALTRKIRRMMTRDHLYRVEDCYAIGKIASLLIPGWLETDYEEFGDYLIAELRLGLGSKIALFALTYYEVPRWPYGSK